MANRRRARAKLRNKVARNSPRCSQAICNISVATRRYVAARIRPATTRADRSVQNLRSLVLSAAFLLGAMAHQTAIAGQPHNVVLFIPDGLRALKWRDFPRRHQERRR
jgi:hypothetical protein